MLSALELDPVESATLMKFKEPKSPDAVLDDFWTVAPHCSVDTRIKIDKGLRACIELFIKCDLIKVSDVDSSMYVISDTVLTISNHVEEKVLPSIGNIGELEGLRINKVYVGSGEMMFLLSNQKVAKLRARSEQYEDHAYEIILDNEVNITDMVALGFLPQSVQAEQYGYKCMVENLKSKIKRYKEFRALGQEFIKG